MQSTNVITATASSNLTLRVRQIVRDARVTSKMSAARNNKRDTIEDARKHTAEKLRANKAYVLDRENVEKPNLVYVQQHDGRYQVGMKYCNRWLVGALEGGNYYADVDESELPALLELLAESAEAGTFDDQIKVIMQANIKAKNKKK
jgi:hypothetical protein